MINSQQVVFPTPHTLIQNVFLLWEWVWMDKKKCFQAKENWKKKKKKKSKVSRLYLLWLMRTSESERNCVFFLQEKNVTQKRVQLPFSSWRMESSIYDLFLLHTGNVPLSNMKMTENSIFTNSVRKKQFSGGWTAIFLLNLKNICL